MEKTLHFIGADLAKKSIDLVIHGLKDKALGQAALNGNWQYVEKHFTLATIPDADHWVQQDAADLVTRTIVSWLNR